MEMSTLDQARYFGVDLARGQRARTSVAVLDEAGRLLQSALVRTDDEVIAFVDRSVFDPLVAAVGALWSCQTKPGELEAQFGRLSGPHLARVGLALPSIVAGRLEAGPQLDSSTTAASSAIDPMAFHTVAAQ
jgi:hypothetical protein